MVGPLSEEERRFGNLQVRIGFVLLVGVSAGLVALSGDPTPVELGLVIVTGLGVGALLLWVMGFGF